MSVAEPSLCAFVDVIICEQISQILAVANEFHAKLHGNNLIRAKMPFPERVAAAVSWMINNKPAVYRVIYLLQGALGLFLIVFGYSAGKEHFHLIRDGVRTQGQIVGHATEYFRDSSRNSSTTAYMPIVEFRVGDRVIHFKNWLGSSSTGNLHTSVVVLYDPADPTSAMIDRSVMNWIPWAPCFAVGVFLVLVAIKGSLSSINT